MFFLKEGEPQAVAFPKLGLRQSGRAGLELLGSIQKLSSTAYRETARANFAADPDGAELNAVGMDDPDQAVVAERLEKAIEICERDPFYRLERFYQRFVSEDLYHQAIPATEERREQFEPLLRQNSPPAGGSLELDPSIALPDYYEGVEWHLRPGGWDGYELYGPMGAYGVGPMIFKHGGYSAVPAGEDIQQQRIDVVSELPKDHYDRIYEPGCGSATTMVALHKVYPEAELVGSDLSPLILKMGHLAAERQGIKVDFKQRDSTRSGEPDASFDAVVTYALHHELPIDANEALFTEMFRILKPGGDIVMSDPPPFRAVSPFHSVILDWDTEHKNEPFFRITCLANWDEMMRKVGFVDVQSYALGKDGYPWVTRGAKPLNA
jgi:ubiquinone/menaquinone biosynthesis C-methylase UbiE